MKARSKVQPQARDGGSNQRTRWSTAEILERRVKRAERRAKQRLTNVGRAAKMHRARIAHPLADRPANTVKQASAPPTVMIGCSGWFYWGWRDIFYPPTIPTSDWFAHYASRFDTVELNAPFYAWPTVATVNSWVKQTGRRKFIYTVKVSEMITHVKKFTGTKRLVEDFGYIADLLGARMGCFLFQFPPSFHFTQARLKAIVAQLDPARRNVVEFRHRSWWNEHVFSAFRKSGTIFCSCSGPRLPDELVKTAEDIYIRFHGIKQWYRHDYAKAELAVWVERIRTSGAKRIWAYFNNDRDGHAIRNARELRRQLMSISIRCFQAA